jgi:hypothetical protein
MMRNTTKYDFGDDEMKSFLLLEFFSPSSIDEFSERRTFRHFIILLN